MLAASPPTPLALLACCPRSAALQGALSWGGLCAIPGQLDQSTSVCCVGAVCGWCVSELLVSQASAAAGCWPRCVGAVSRGSMCLLRSSAKRSLARVSAFVPGWVSEGVGVPRPLLLLPLPLLAVLASGGELRCVKYPPARSPLLLGGGGGGGAPLPVAALVMLFVDVFRTLCEPCPAVASVRRVELVACPRPPQVGSRSQGGCLLACCCPSLWVAAALTGSVVSADGVASGMLEVAAADACGGGLTCSVVSAGGVAAVMLGGSAADVCVGGCVSSAVVPHCTSQ